MKKGTKVLALTILSVFLISMIATIASAAPSDTNNPIQQISDVLKNLFSANSTNYDYMANILSPQILLFVLIFLIVFAIVENIPIFGKHGWVSVAVSIVVAILSAGFINVDWIKPILNQYTALGITISFLLPFVLIFYFLKEMAPYNELVHRIIWSVYGFVMIFNAALNWSRLDSPFTKFLYFVLGILALIMIFKSGAIYRRMFREDIQEAVLKYEDVQALITANKKQEANAALYSIGSQLPPATYERLKKQIEKMK
jgi:hypothetical protein